MTSATPCALLLAALVTLNTGCGHGHGGGAHSAWSHSGSSHSWGHSSSSHSSSSHSGSSSSHTASNGRSGSSGSGSHGSRASHHRSHSGGSGAAGEYVGWDGSSDPADYGYSVPPAPGGYGPDDEGPPPPARAETPCQRAQREWLEQYPGLPRPYVLRCGPNGEWGVSNPDARPDPGDDPLEGAPG